MSCIVPPGEPGDKMAADESANSNERAPWVALTRLVVGLAQGLALYLLDAAMEGKHWPATDGAIYAPLLFVSLFVPLIALVGIGNLRMTTLLVWTVLSALIVAGLARYGIWQSPGDWNGALAVERIVPMPELFVFTFAGLFIAQSLITGGDQDRRFVAAYTTHFDVAWKFGLQLVLSAVFVGIFWGVLELGVSLFDLIGITGFSHFIEHRWFWLPATTLALAAAIHLTDVRAGLVRGTRTLVLVLLSWLLPLMAGIAAAFLFSLIFTGLSPLWKTGFAAGYLLSAAGTLVFLINAAYQDGAAERLPPVVLRVAGTVACVLLVPLVAISVYAVYLRVAQYGWTAERVNSCACLVVAASYAGGYAFAAVARGPWLERIARWNFLTALLVLAVLVAIFSPIADPMRIAVASQVARLEAGKIRPDQFDFGYLRWNSGRFGIDALHALEKFSPPPRFAYSAAYIRDKAKAAFETKTLVEPVAVAQDIAANVTVYPKGGSLPASFLSQKWNEGSDLFQIPNCLRNTANACDAYILDLGGDGREEIAVIGVDRRGQITSGNALFEQAPSGRWQFAGTPDQRWSCPKTLVALRSGQWRFVAPVVPRWRNLLTNGQTLTVRSPESDDVSCPQ